MKTTALFMAAIVLAAATASYAYKFIKFYDDFDGFTVTELTDNDVSRRGDGYNLYLNLQKIETEGAAPAISFVIIYIGNKDEEDFRIADSESLTFLADGTKFPFARCEGYDDCAAEYVADWIKRYRTGEGITKALTGEEDKLPFFHDIALYPVAVPDLDAILAANEVKFRLIGEDGKKKDETLDNNDLNDLRQFHYDHLNSSSDI